MVRLVVEGHRFATRPLLTRPGCPLIGNVGGEGLPQARKLRERQTTLGAVVLFDNDLFAQLRFLIGALRDANPERKRLRRIRRQLLLEAGKSGPDIVPATHQIELDPG